MNVCKLLIFIFLVQGLWGCSFFQTPDNLPPSGANIKQYPDLTFVDNPEVRVFLKFYTTEGRKFVSDSLKRQSQDGERVRTLLRSWGIPETFINLAVVESGFRSDAVSPAGAAGLWQFMPETAEHYGLKVCIIKDERHDIERSTVAAAKYLVDLYNRFGDWYLALAAYNAGPMRIQRALIETKTKDFFSLARTGVLQKESADFVAKVIALSIINKNPQTYGFIAPQQTASNNTPKS